MFILHTLLANCFNIRCEKFNFLDRNPIGQKIRYKNMCVQKNIHRAPNNE